MPHDRLMAAFTSLGRRASRLIFAAIAISWLCACIGQEPGRKVAGGTGSEAGDAYGVAWSVLGEKAAASARVSLYATNDTSYAHPTLQAETRADAKGAFRFGIKREGHYDLEIRAADEDAILYKRGIFLRAGAETDLGRLSLPAAARFRWSLPTPPPGPTRLWLDATPYSAVVDSLGAFAFAPLPAGTYRLFSERIAADSLVRVDLGDITLNPGDSIVPPVTDSTKPDTIPAVPPLDTVIVVPPLDTVPVVPPLDTVPVVQIDSVLIENFDDGGEISSYGRKHGNGRWTATAEGGMPMYPITGAFDAFTTVMNGGAGKSLAVAYSPALISQRAIVELDMGSKDMTGPVPDSLVFWAKGRGRLVFEALLWVAPTTGSSGARSAAFTVILTATWKQYRVPVFADSIARRPGYLRFSGSMGQSFFLDEILYKGAKPGSGQGSGAGGG